MVFSSTDRLPPLLTRRSFDLQARHELTRSSRYQRPLTMLAIDICYFEHIKKTYGHPAGDEVLRILANCMREAIRPSDVLGKLGGGHFAMLLPETVLSNATSLAARLRTKVGQTRIVYRENLITVAISIGMTELTPAAAIGQQSADHMLCEAKLSATTVLSSRE